MTRRLLVCLPIVSALLFACGSSDDGAGNPSNTGATQGAATGCAADTRKDIYTAGMTRAASDFEVHLIDSQWLPKDQAPQIGQVQKGANQITVEIVDAAKAPVDDAQITLTPFMPDHGHGTAAVPVVTPQGGGKYQISNVWLPMAGLWRFTLSFKRTSDTSTREAVFNFCVDG